MKGIGPHYLPGKAVETQPSRISRAFNYGRNLPWYALTSGGRNPPQEYVRTELLRAAIAKRQNILSGAEWALSEALTFVRNAETQAELERALADLARVRVANDPLGIDGTFNQANMPSDAQLPIGDNGNGHVFFEDLPVGCDE